MAWYWDETKYNIGSIFAYLFSIVRWKLYLWSEFVLDAVRQRHARLCPRCQDRLVEEQALDQKASEVATAVYAKDPNPDVPWFLTGLTFPCPVDGGDRDFIGWTKNSKGQWEPPVEEKKR